MPETMSPCGPTDDDAVAGAADPGLWTFATLLAVECQYAAAADMRISSPEPPNGMSSAGTAIQQPPVVAVPSKGVSPALCLANQDARYHLAGVESGQPGSVPPRTEPPIRSPLYRAMLASGPAPSSGLSLHAASAEWCCIWGRSAWQSTARWNVSSGRAEEVHVPNTSSGVWASLALRYSDVSWQRALPRVRAYLAACKIVEPVVNSAGPRAGSKT